MREICQSGSEGGVALTCHSYPYQGMAVCGGLRPPTGTLGTAGRGFAYGY